MIADINLCALSADATWRLAHTLFPYTTLFRSVAAVGAAAGGGAEPGAADAAAWPEHGRLHPVPDAGDRCVRDRKSTRLNSSHVAISYAVFCLRKKSLIRMKLMARGGVRRAR